MQTPFTYQIPSKTRHKRIIAHRSSYPSISYNYPQLHQYLLCFNHLSFHALQKHPHINFTKWISHLPRIFQLTNLHIPLITITTMGTISIREHIRWIPDPESEPTSTIVLTSPGHRFVDLRILRPENHQGPWTGQDGKFLIQITTALILKIIIKIHRTSFSRSSGLGYRGYNIIYQSPRH